MNIVHLLIQQNLIMFIYLLIGYYLFHKKLVSREGSADIGKILLHVIIPATIVKSYCTNLAKESLIGLVVSFTAALAALILSIFITRICFKREDGLERFGVAFSNAGFIGIPLVQATLGSQATFYAASFVALLNIMQWTYGVFVMTGDCSAISWKKIRTNPIVLGFLSGIIVFLLPIELPNIVAGTLETLAAMNGPLAMMVLGIYLAQVPFQSIFTEWDIYKSTLIRLLLIPLLTIPLFMWLPEVYNEIKLTIVIVAAAPVGSNVAIFAQLYDKNYQKAVKEICMSTLFCIVTLPLVVGVANLLLYR